MALASTALEVRASTFGPVRGTTRTTDLTTADSIGSSASFNYPPDLELGPPIQTNDVPSTQLATFRSSPSLGQLRSSNGPDASASAPPTPVSPITPGPTSVKAPSPQSDPSPTKSNSPVDIASSNLLLSIPPPPPYDLLIDNLTIGLPSSKNKRTKKGIHSLIPSFLSPLSKSEKASAPGETSEKPAIDPSRAGGSDGTEGKTIVRNVTASCHAGEMMVLLGGSGSGKTTLLNALAGRLGSLPILQGGVEFVRADQGSGHVAGGHKEGEGRRERRERQKDEKGIGRRIGFVRQNDHLLPYLTVRETLEFSAALRLPRSVTNDERKVIVEQTIQELGLVDAADTVVGGALRKGISGGERRRLSIGCVLVTLPSILVLDEPTSGLDAFTSQLLLQSLSSLAKTHNRTVILSIHAPRSDAFPLFDKVLLLSKGSLVYAGPGSSSLPWFSSLGWNVERGVNPLDFLIDVSSVDNRDVEAEEASKERVNRLVKAWKDSEDSGREKQFSVGEEREGRRPKVVISKESSLQGLAELETRDPRRPGLLKQTAVLLRRSHLNVYRNYGQLIGFAVQAIVIGVLLGFTFFQLGETPADVQSLKNISFQLIPAFFYLTQVYWIFAWCQALIIFDSEREDNLYSVVPFVVADFVSVLGPAIITPLIYVIIVYTMGNLRNDPYGPSLFTVVAAAILVHFVIQGLALMSASIIRNFPQASIICNALSLFQTISAGFVLVNVPPWVAWFRWISPQFYAYRINAPTLLADRMFACPGVVGVARSQCDGNKVLNGLGISRDTNIGVWFAGLVGLFLAEHIIAILLLQFWHPGGVKYAGKTPSSGRGKEPTVTGKIDLPRAKIDVELRHVSLAWKRRSFWPFFGQAEKKILRDVSASFPAGEVSAIIGPSGAGKSTILSMLAHRELRPGTYASFVDDGQMLFNGQPATKDIKNSIAFVEQDDDYHLSGLTVRETLRYAAILRLPETMSRKNKIARAEEVLLMLGLKDCANVLVGGPLLKGISGGEKRRLSLAVQMISDPCVLVVDEPTSGLDSFIAAAVMSALTDIARTGRTVIATIHQPRSDIVAALDNLTVLAKGGSVVYSGKNIDAVPWFEAHGYDLPSEWFNPADHILDVVSTDPRPGREIESNERVSSLVSSWATQVAKEEEAHESSLPSSSMSTSSPKERSNVTSIKVALPVVLHRMVLNLYRQKEAFFNRLTQAPLLAALFILFYTRLTHGPSGAQDRIGVTLENVNAIPFVGLLNGIAIFPQDRDVFFHEHKSSAAYSSFTFITAYTLFEVSMTIMASFLYTLIMHVAVGMQTSYRIFFEFSFSIWACLSLGESIAICFASFSTQLGIAVSLVSTFLAVVCQISGIVSLSVPDWLSGIAWATPLKPAVKVQFINECRNLTFNCSPESITSGACVATSGNELLSSLGFVDLNTEKFMGILIASTIAWRVIAWVCLEIRIRLH